MRIFSSIFPVKMIRKIFITCIFTGSLFRMEAQTDTTGLQDDKASYGKASLEFTSNSVYNGRKDSIVTPYLAPTIGYYSKSGFYTEASLSVLLRSGSTRIDMGSLSAGYDYEKGNFGAGIYAAKDFYNNSSTNVRSEVKGEISGTVSYDFGFISTYLEPGISFSTKSDYHINWDIDHSFKTAGGKLEIDPSFLLEAATRNFAAAYYANRKFGRPKKKNPGQVTVSATVKDASALKILDYNFSIPFTYKLKKWVFGFTPNYVIPESAAEVTVVLKPAVGPLITKIINEKLANTFYATFSIGYRF